MAESDEGNIIWGDLTQELNLGARATRAPAATDLVAEISLESLTPAILQEFFRTAVRMRNAVVDTLVHGDWQTRLAQGKDVAQATYFRLAIPEDSVPVTKAYLAILKLRGEAGKIFLRFGRPEDPRCFEKECSEGEQLLKQIRDAFREAVLTYKLLRSRTIYQAMKPNGGEGK